MLMFASVGANCISRLYEVCNKVTSVVIHKVINVNHTELVDMMISYEINLF